MKKYCAILVITIPIVIGSCVRSLYPLTENEEESFFKPDLLGCWIQSDSSLYIVDTVPGKKGKLYKVATIDASITGQSEGFSDTSYFVATLTDINGKFFLDCSADMEMFANKMLGDWTVSSLVQTHYIVRLSWLAGDSIELASLDEDAFSKLLQSKKFSIQHQEISEDDLLLTERPKQLQQKLKQLEKFPSVFNPCILSRVKK